MKEGTQMSCHELRTNEKRSVATLLLVLLAGLAPFFAIAITNPEIPPAVQLALGTVAPLAEPGPVAK
jgi:hypothetical protein